MSEKSQVVRELHKYARKIFPRRKYSIRAIAETIQMDLLEVQPFKRENRGYRYILVAIDVFSKVCYAEPLHNKTGPETCKAMERIIRRIFNRTNRIAKNIQTDSGREFFNKITKQMLEKYSINHYSTFSIMKSSIVERLIRTLKHRLYMQFSLQGNYRWADKLSRIVEEYNNTRYVINY